MTPHVVVVAPDQFAEVAATSIADAINVAIGSRGTCALALCGGTTPVPVYGELARCAIDWPNTSIWFGDERAVPPDHADSNYGMARRSLLDHVAIAPGRIHRMAAEREDLDVAAQEYDALLPPRFDVLLLGIGIDGHTASLFPGSPAVNESSRRVVPTLAPPPPITPHIPRMTITPLAIAAARQIVVLVQGREKADTLRRILEGPDQPTVLPAQCARAGSWIVDQAAATELQSRDS